MGHHGHMTCFGQSCTQEELAERPLCPRWWLRRNSVGTPLSVGPGKYNNGDHNTTAMLARKRLASMSKQNPGFGNAGPVRKSMSHI